MADATLVLNEVSSLVQEGYYDEYLPQHDRMSGTLGRLLKLAGEPVSGDGKTWQNEIQKYDSVRGSTDMISDFASPGQFVPLNVKVRWNESTPASNDFIKLSGSGQTSIWEVSGATNNGTIIAIAKRLLDQLTADFGEKRAIYQNITRSARLALVNGAPKNNDANTFASCTTYTAGSTTARILVDNGSLAFFKPGVILDAYTSVGGLDFTLMVVTDVNYGDGSVGLGRYSSDSSTNFDQLADNDEIFLNSTRNMGAYSAASWYSLPVAGESFIGGVDRTSANYRWMYPTTYVPTGATATAPVPIQTAFFDSLALSMQYAQDDPYRLTPIIMPLDISQSLRTKIGNDAFVPFTALGQDMQKRYADFGITNLNYQHPAFGMVSLMSDVFATPGTVRFYNPSTWLSLQYGTRGLQFMNDGDIGMWRRLPSNVAGNGYSMIYRCEAYETLAVYCTNPYKNGQIINVTA